MRPTSCRRRVLPLLICLILVGCEGNPELSAVGNEAVIVAFGDSLTAGVGAGKSYPEILQRLTGLTVINAGISGEVTAMGLRRFGNVLNRYDPALVILMEGGNDILRDYNLSDTQNNLEAILAIARDRGVEMILIGVPDKSLLPSTADLYDKIAQANEVVYERDLLTDLLRSSRYKSDPIHLNDEGYRLFAEEIYSLLQRKGAL